MRTTRCAPSLLLLTMACQDMDKFLGTVDDDRDGYFENAEALEEYGYGPDVDDCDDTNEDVHPGATDLCNTGSDENCDQSRACFRWPSGEQPLDPTRSAHWYHGDNSARLGWAVGATVVEDKPMALVSAPNAGGGAVFYLPWAEGGGGLGDGGTITGPPGARLGAAMLPELSLGDSSYLVLGAPGTSAVYAVNTATLTIGGSLDLSDETSLTAGEGSDSDADYDGALAASTVLDDSAPVLFLGASIDDTVVPLSCSSKSGEFSCAPGTVLTGEEGSGFGSALAVLEVAGGVDGLLAVSAPGTCQVRLFRLGDAVSGEQSTDETATALTIELPPVEDCDMRLLAANLIGEVGEEATYPDLLIGLPGEDRVYLLDGEQLLEDLGDSDAPVGLLDLDPHHWDGTDGSRYGSALFSDDLDGDGKPDLLVGAPRRGDAAQGELWLLQDMSGALAAEADEVYDLGAQLIPSSDEETAFGAAIAVVPSLDGDPYPDLLIGAPDEQNVYPYDGSLYVVQGRGD